MKQLEASEPKSVNSILNIILVNSLRPGGLQLTDDKFKFSNIHQPFIFSKIYFSGDSDLSDKHQEKISQKY